MELHISLAGRGDLTARIYRELLEAILDGRLRGGDRLPPTRELARRLVVSRGTVSLAYDRLAAEGFLEARVGAGTYVRRAAAPREDTARVGSGGGLRTGSVAGTGGRSGAGSSGGSSAGSSGASSAGGSGGGPRGSGRSAPSGGPRPAAQWAGVLAALARDDDRAVVAYDFEVGVPDVTLFPFDVWRRLATRALRASAVPEAIYLDPAGSESLRQGLARYVGLARAVRAGPDDLIVTQGAQQALDLIARVVLEPGDVVAVEEPGYPPARRLFEALGARVRGVPVDAEGLRVEAIPRGTRLVYATPSHQFPLGTVMSLARRNALLDWANRQDAVIVEDDYDSEFRFADRPLDPLQSLDRDGRVVYVGTFSKTLLPTLRLGFLVAPASLRSALHAAKRLADRQGDLVSQAALARFVDEGLLARHVRKANRAYVERHRVVSEALRRDFARWFEVVPSAAGLHVCARLRTGVSLDVERLVAQAYAQGVRIESLATYCAQTPTLQGIVLGYGRTPPATARAGLRRLLACARSLTEARVDTADTADARGL